MAEMESHGENLERVSARMAPSVKQFCREHCGPARRFHADQLRRYVTLWTGINAPASADRVLRLLRQQHKLDYIVVSRRESLYEVLWVRSEPGAPPQLTIVPQ